MQSSSLEREKEAQKESEHTLLLSIIDQEAHFDPG